MSAKNTVKFTLDPNPPVQSDEQQKRLADIAAMPDEAIDYSDIPALPADARWAKPGAMVSSANKQQITLRIDADVLEFFKDTGKRYQSRINAVLRAYVAMQKNHG